MISKTSEYALRAAVHMGRHPEGSLTNGQIAEATRVPAGYLAKVMQALGRAGLVHAQRGLRGGFTLARRPDQITVLDLINAVDPIRRIDACPLQFESHRANLCRLHRRLDGAIALVEREFKRCRLSDLLSTRSGIPALCERRPVRKRATRRATPARRTKRR